MAFQASAIESGIVGYETVNVASKKYVALAIQFEGLGETTSIAVKDLVAEMASSISGDDIRTMMRYYADPSQPNIGSVRILDLL